MTDPLMQFKSEHDITKDCDVRGFEHRWETRDDGITVCIDCGKVCDTNNDKEAE